MEIETRKHISGGKIWYKKGNIHYWHREDGPACILDNGDEQWWYYDKFYEYIKEMPLNLFISYCKWEYRKNGKRM